jgi:hypothetical protein
VSLDARNPAWLGLALLLLCPAEVGAWGFATHRMINEMAIDTLPEPLRSFFVGHRQEISDLAIEPDTVLRARYGQREAVRHFIDLDLYGKAPFSELPRSYEQAVKRFGSETVTERGTLPWTILESHAVLVREMRAGNWEATLVTAGHSGHYVGDAFMPLHTTDNHDGQKSGQSGIHAAIEHELVDARVETYLRRIRQRIPRLTTEPFGEERVFAILIDSYSDVAVLLRADRQARGLARFRSPAYLEALDERVRNVIASRLGAAVATLGSFWLSAWEKAGRPAPPTQAF